MNFREAPSARSDQRSGSHARIDLVVRIQNDVAKRFATTVGLPKFHWLRAADQDDQDSFCTVTIKSGYDSDNNQWIEATASTF